MKCLILRSSSLGDIVHTFPAISELKKNREVQIDYLVDSAFVDVVRTNADIGKIWELPFLGMKKFGFFKFISYATRLIKEINKEKYDIIIDLHNVFKTSFLNFFLKGRKYTFTKLKEPLPVYTQQFEVSEQRKVYRYKQLFGKIFGYEASGDVPNDRLVNQILPANIGLIEKNYTILIIDSSWETKIPDFEFWQRLIETSKEGENLVILNHTHLARQIVEFFPQVRLLPRLSLAEAIAVVSKAKSIIGVDTGLAHMGASFSVPCVMIFGATNEKFYSFYKNLTNLQAKIPCSACYNKRCKLAKTCYNDIEPSLIWLALKKKLGNKNE